MNDAPTHRCKTCGALWILVPGDPTAASEAQRAGFWSLRSPTCGQCCDVAPMGEQIEELEGEALRAAQTEWALRQGNG